MIHLLLALAAQRPDTSGPEVWAPHRVYDAHHKEFSDFETLATAAAHADVVFLGEHHDDAGTHRMELALLQAVARRRANVVLALEMFERDVQPILDQYLAGAITEEAFLKASRPWPNYNSDYRPLVEFARVHHWPVIAGNVPRKMAAAVATGGLDAVSHLVDSTRPFAAADFGCATNDDYFKRFGQAMAEHPMGAGAPTVENMYQAQCVKDETMAESIARARGDAGAPLVIQYNGDFHSDFGEGVAERTRRRLPNAKIVIISAIPVTSLDSIEAKPMRKRGDWLLFVLEPRALGSGSN
jgi:uncharacterized iron-regulated protein